MLAPPHSTQQQGAPPAIIGWFFMIIRGHVFLLGESFAACVFAAARFIRSCRRYWFIFVVACLHMLFSLRHGAWRLYHRRLITPFREAAIRHRRE